MYLHTRSLDEAHGFNNQSFRWDENHRLPNLILLVKKTARAGVWDQERHIPGNTDYYHYHE